MILVPSKHLVKIKCDNNSSVIYNSLLGGVLRIDEKGWNFIQKFKNGLNIRRDFSKGELCAYKNIVSELKKKYIFIEKGYDEYSLLKVDYEELKRELRQGKYINYLRLEMASYCNFRCQYCFAPKKYDWKKDAKMSFDTARLAINGFLNLLKKNNNAWGSIGFWGGEPLLDWRVIKQIVEYVEKINKHPAIVIHYAMLTNGSLLNDAILKFMKRHKIDVQVSLDGLEDENDRCRRFLNGRGTFKYITRGLEGLSKHGIRFGVQLTLTDYNFHNVEKMMDFVQDRYSCARFVIGPVFYKEGISDYDHYSNKEKAERIVEIYDYAVKNGISIGGPGLNSVNLAIDQKPIRFHCSARFDRLYVKPSGSIHPCQEVNFSIGDVHDVESIPRGKNYVHVAARGIDKLKSCRGCEIEGFCGGGCAGIAEFYSGDIYNISVVAYKDFYCDFVRCLFREMLLYLSKKAFDPTCMNLH